MRSRFFGGVGLRSLHYPDFLEGQVPPQISWLEVISENYMDSQGRPRKIIRQLRDRFPIACHGVSLSIAGPDDLDFNYLEKLKRLLDDVEPFIVSDHLCWTGHSAHNIHDLLPIVHNEETLEYVSARVTKVQDYLKRRLALENVSAYIESKHSTMSEAEFLKQLSKKTGCRVLLDLNNIYVSETNFLRDPKLFIDTLPREAIAQIHLAGFSDRGKFLFDTHSKPVFPAVWELYQYALPKISEKPILLEWDEEIPSLDRLGSELQIAHQLRENFLQQPQRERTDEQLEAAL
jgi:uncharacterized protein